MQRSWDVDKYFVKNTVKNLAVSDIFLNTHTPPLTTPPALVLSVEKRPKVVFSPDKQKANHFFIKPEAKQLSLRGSFVLPIFYSSKKTDNKLDNHHHASASAKACALIALIIFKI